MERTKVPCAAYAKPLEIDEVQDAGTWLHAWAVEYGLRWLLAFGEEGVVWGKFENGKLITSHEAAAGTPHEKYCPALRTELLHQARLFSKDAELLLWRDGDGDWHARLIVEGQAETSVMWSEAFDEAQLLFGTEVEAALSNGFTLMRDGAEGLRHAVPLPVMGEYDERSRPLRLTVRNYLKDDEAGFVHVVASRLVKVEVGE